MLTTGSIMLRPRPQAAGFPLRCGWTRPTSPHTAPTKLKKEPTMKLAPPIIARPSCPPPPSREPSRFVAITNATTANKQETTNSPMEAIPNSEGFKPTRLIDRFVGVCECPRFSIMPPQQGKGQSWRENSWFLKRPDSLNPCHSLINAPINRPSLFAKFPFEIGEII